LHGPLVRLQPLIRRPGPPDAAGTGAGDVVLGGGAPPTGARGAARLLRGGALPHSRRWRDRARRLLLRSMQPLILPRARGPGLRRRRPVGGCKCRGW
jgi:hypothetical protein